MKTKLFRISCVLITALVTTISCQDEDRISNEDLQDISEEALTDSYFQDVDDMSAVAVQAPEETEFNGGREKTTIEVNDSRFNCGGQPLLVTFERLEGSTVAVPKGRMIVDFGAGCTDLRQNTRKGKIIITFTGRRMQQGSTVVTTFENYSINDIALTGVRTRTNITASEQGAPKFNVVLEDGKAVFPDGLEATRESDITWTWVRAQNPSDDQLIIDPSSTAEGTTRNGRSYEVSLLEELVYKRFCGLAVSGIKQYQVDNDKVITIDYGDGNCDREVTITVNGVTRNVSVD